MRRLKRIYLRLAHNTFVSSDSEFIQGKTLLKNDEIRITGNSQLIIGDKCMLKNCRITITTNARLVIENGAILQNMHIFIDNAQCVIGKSCSLSDSKIEVITNSKIVFGESCIIEKGNQWHTPAWSLQDNSVVEVADHNRFRCDLYSRFGATITIGCYNCLNEGTEIRADERVSIGDYNMISYNCRIWDTNTHVFYSDYTRREMTERMFPYIGIESEKPRTKPVYIGSDNLIGESAAILKGSKIENKCKIGFRAIVSNEDIADDSTFVSKRS